MSRFNRLHGRRALSRAGRRKERGMLLRQPAGRPSGRDIRARLTAAGRACCCILWRVTQAR